MERSEPETESMGSGVDTDLWGKLATGPPPRSHPLFLHMLDTGHVMGAMWQGVLASGLRRWFAQQLGLSESATVAWFCFWASLHDIGKATPAFQRKASTLHPEVFQKLKNKGYRFPQQDSTHGHGLLTAKLLTDIGDGPFGRLNPGWRRTLASVLGGHHGIFPSSSAILAPTSGDLGVEKWTACQRSLVDGLACHWRVGDFGLPTTLKPGASFCMVFAGLVSVTDWIASSERHFPHAGTDVDPTGYADRLPDRAMKVLHDLHWIGWRAPAAPAPFGELFPDNPANALQQAVEDVGRDLAGPSLVVIEAPTGVGKTEAALCLADRWAATCGQRGYYFALPTQATSNQMFARVREFLARRSSGEEISLMLLHGHASLSAEFETLLRRGEVPFVPANVSEDSDRPGDASILAGEWFTYRKRGLLAPFGVGTIDQALLAVLQTRHVFVRLFGLAGKTVILDEVHAYDTYMTTLIERLLEWLAAMECSVVLLSATLPREKRKQLIEAYQRGLSVGRRADLRVGYPRIAWVSRDGLGERSVPDAEGATRAVAVTRVDGALPTGGRSDFDLGRQLAEALQGGGCAAVICNTVGRAQKLYAALKTYFPARQLDLLHSRYLFGDRQEREQRVLHHFSKPGGQDVRRPKKSVLVATQIIEQSLDVDFDLMITDLAPADLLLQRAGRLHRHSRDRPDRLRDPALWICWPDEANGTPQFDGGTRHVYDEHVLLRTWLALRNRKSIRIPDDVEPLIESVYDPHLCPKDLPAPLRALWKDTLYEHDRSMEAESNEARDRWVKSPLFTGELWRMTKDPLEADRPDLHPAHQALTRLAGPSVSIVCLRRRPQDEDSAELSAQTVDFHAVPTVELARRLLMRSVTIFSPRPSAGGLVAELATANQPEGWRKCPLLRHHRLVVFDANDSAQVGRYHLRLNPETGLSIERT